MSKENYGNDPDRPDPYPWETLDADACLQLVGDVNLLHRDYPPSAFRHVTETLAAADVLFGNLETCLYRPGDDDIPKKPWWQHSEENMVEGLVDAGFDAIGHANNVTYGHAAIRNTLDVLNRKGIAHCGAGESLTDAQAPAIVTVNGTTFGFLQRTARYYGADAIATDESPGVAAIDPDEDDYLDEPASAIEVLRPEVDILVFSHHLRETGINEIEPYQRELAYRAIDAGADIVVGHGAHEVQAIELYRGCPIFHSIGQFAFDGEKIQDQTDGILVRIHVDSGDVTRVGFVPVSRDEANDVYLAGPETPDGSRQLNLLEQLSPDDLFSFDGTEGVVDLSAGGY